MLHCCLLATSSPFFQYSIQHFVAGNELLAINQVETMTKVIEMPDESGPCSNQTVPLVLTAIFLSHVCVESLEERSKFFSRDRVVIVVEGGIFSDFRQIYSSKDFTQVAVDIVALLDVASASNARLSSSLVEANRAFFFGIRRFSYRTQTRYQTYSQQPFHN